MSRFIPIRDQVGRIIDVRPKEEVDAVQATLDASLKAVGAVPATEPSTSPAKEQQSLQRPSWRMIAIAVAALSMGVLAITLFSGRTQAPSRPSVIALPTVTLLPT